MSILGFFNRGGSGAKLPTSSKTGSGKNLPMPQKQIERAHRGSSGGSSKGLPNIADAEAVELSANFADGLTLEEKLSYIQAVGRRSIVKYFLCNVPTTGIASGKTVYDCLEKIWLYAEDSDYEPCVMSVLGAPRELLSIEKEFEIVELLIGSLKMNADVLVSFIAPNGQVSWELLSFFLRNLPTSFLSVSRDSTAGCVMQRLLELPIEVKPLSKQERVDIFNRLLYSDTLPCIYKDYSEIIVKFIASEGIATWEELEWWLKKIQGYIVITHLHQRISDIIYGLLKLSVDILDESRRDICIDYCVKSRCSPKNLIWLMEFTKCATKVQKPKQLPDPSQVSGTAQASHAKEYIPFVEVDDCQPNALTIGRKLYYYDKFSIGLCYVGNWNWHRYLFVELETKGSATGNELSRCLSIINTQIKDPRDRATAVASVMKVSLISLTELQKKNIVYYLGKLGASDEDIIKFSLRKPFGPSEQTVKSIGTDASIMTRIMSFFKN